MEYLLQGEQILSFSEVRQKLFDRVETVSIPLKRQLCQLFFVSLLKNGLLKAHKKNHHYKRRNNFEENSNSFFSKRSLQ